MKLKELTKVMTWSTNLHLQDDDMNTIVDESDSITEKSKSWDTVQPYMEQEVLLVEPRPNRLRIVVKRLK